MDAVDFLQRPADGSADAVGFAAQPDGSAAPVHQLVQPLAAALVQLGHPLAQLAVVDQQVGLLDVPLHLCGPHTPVWHDRVRTTAVSGKLVSKGELPADVCCLRKSP